jgi:hypothetical protein
MSRISIEGESVEDFLDWPEEYFDQLVLTDEPIVFHIATAEVLGQFAIKDRELIVELAQIERSGEGVLPAISKISKHLCELKSLENISCVVHAIDCATPNRKLRAHLDKMGFVVSKVPGKGKAYYKQIPVK